METETLESTTDKQFVRDLKDKQAVRSVFLVVEKMVLNDKNGRPYMSLTLSDVSGSINGRVWDNVEGLVDQFQQGDFVQVKGHVQIFQNKPQIIVHTVEVAEESTFQLKDFLASSVRAPEDMYSDLLEKVETVKNDHLRQLMLAVLKDPEIRPNLLKSPAAKSIHHAYVGGLLEHILSICGIMEFLADHYSFLNRDFLLFGAIFHDIGKVFELAVVQGIQYTNKGRLVGHMAIACELIDEKAHQILGFPKDLKDLCKHIVLSHHGKLEYGSPKRPKFLEAMVVALVDELDSKIDTMKRVLESEVSTQADWSSYSPQFDRYIYLDLFRRLQEEKTNE